ncbi:hypothetical protein [Desulfitobacterium hafniense]|uniref:hypothetical protein n=1 Tax=Desulfitobacterium hafniense TaxID=49338 RepID=UPI0002FFD58C|nr:hypothetical protein [Desulfitobacterium hafniense]
MPIFNFESKDKRVKREIEKLANEIAQEAAKNFDYDPDEDTALRKFRKKMGLPLKKGKNK